MTKRILALDPSIARDYLADVPLCDIATRYAISVPTIYRSLHRQNLTPGERLRRTGSARFKAMWTDPAFRRQQAAKGRAALLAHHAGTLTPKPPKFKVPPELRADWRTLKFAQYTKAEAAKALGLE